MDTLRLGDGYSREQIHDVFEPDTRFTAQTGTWGMQGMVRIRERPGDWVFFVSHGRGHGDRYFDESITSDGVLTWQSQPKLGLDSPAIQELINHDPTANTIYLFLRPGDSGPYVYLGRLAYLDHDPEREHPVWFHWKLLDWPPPTPALDMLGLAAAARRSDARLALDDENSRDVLGREVLASHLDAVLNALMGPSSPGATLPSRGRRDEHPEGNPVGARPVVVLVDGRWGTGKTTLVNQLLSSPRGVGVGPERRLRNPVVVHYDAWSESAISPEWWSIGAEIVRSVQRERSLSARIAMSLTGLLGRIWRSKSLLTAIVVILALAVIGLSNPETSQSIQRLGALLAAGAAAAIVLGQALFWTSPAFGRLHLSTRDSVLDAVGVEVARVRRWSPRSDSLQRVAESGLATTGLVACGVSVLTVGWGEGWVWLGYSFDWVIAAILGVAVAALWLGCWPAASTLAAQAWRFGLAAAAGVATFAIARLVADAGSDALVVLAVALVIAGAVFSIMWLGSTRATKRPLLVVVDDVDRCHANRVTRLIETIHTLLRHDDPPRWFRSLREPAGLAVIVLADGRWIRRAFAEDFGSFAALGSEQHDLGADFLQKVFDHTVIVPLLSGEQRDSYTRHVTGSPSTSGELAQADVDKDLWQDIEQAGLASAYSPDMDQRIRAQPTDVQRVGAESYRAVQAVVGSGPTGEAALAHLLTDHASVMPPNPRLIKRVANTYAMLLALRGAVGHSEELGTVARAASLAVQFPSLADELLSTRRMPSPAVSDGPDTSAWAWPEVRALVLGSSHTADAEADEALQPEQLRRLARCLGRPEDPPGD